MKPAGILRDRRVLVTAGPTWVAVDRVRVVTSIFSGETGLRLARGFADQGCQVTLLMGPGRAQFDASDPRRLDIHSFFYYEELQALLHSFLRATAYDVIVHSAAVADYRPTHLHDGKIASGQSTRFLELTPTQKLIDWIHTNARGTYLIAFKLEVGKAEEELIEAGLEGLSRHGADLVVANDLEQMKGGKHIAYVIDSARHWVRVENKTQLCEELVERTARHLQEKA